MRNHPIFLTLAAALLAVGGMGAAQAQSAPGKSLHDTLDHVFILGFQGWFSCPKDGAGWGHWKGNGLLSVDMIPDVSEFADDELCPTGLKGRDGAEVKLFSDRNPATVDRQFGWMERYRLDGVALQRFGAELSDPARRKGVDQVLENVRAAAERRGVSFFVMYDLSGLSDDRLDGVADDWANLIARGIPNSAAYQFDSGKAVLGLWGLGFAKRPISPAGARKFVEKLRMESRGVGGLTILAGVPAGWSVGGPDASDDPAWKTFWPSVDILSPWTVGRFENEAGADAFRETHVVPDMAAAAAMGVRYMPVVFPGYSSHNLTLARTSVDTQAVNKIPRNCGKFYWRQIADATSAGATMLYGAMFDEVNEGTALFKVAQSDGNVPGLPPLVYLNADGCDTASDFYLRLTGAATKILHAGEPIPKAMPQTIK